MITETKYNFYDKFYSVSYDTTGEIEETCLDCEGSGYLLTKRNLYQKCIECNGLGRITKTKSLPKVKENTIIGIRQERYIKKLELKGWKQRETYVLGIDDNYNFSVTYSTEEIDNLLANEAYFLNKEDAQKKCNEKNKEGEEE